MKNKKTDQIELEQEQPGENREYEKSLIQEEEQIGKEQIEKEQIEKEQFEEKELRLEDLLSQVELCVEQLDDPQISLEDAFRYYEEGIRKLKLCNEKVARIEQKMQVVNQRGELEDFM